MGISQFLKFVGDEWAVIGLAPGTFIVFSLLVAGICIGGTREWFKRQVVNAESTTKNHESMVKLKDAELKAIQEENKKLKDEVVQLKPQSQQAEQLIPVTHGNAAIKELFDDIISRKRVQLPTHPTDSTKWKKAVWALSGHEFDRLVAARRIVQSGLGDIKEQDGGYFLSTSAAAMSSKEEWENFRKSLSTTLPSA